MAQQQLTALAKLIEWCDYEASIASDNNTDTLYKAHLELFKKQINDLLPTERAAMEKMHKLGVMQAGKIDNAEDISELTFIINFTQTVK